MRKLLLAFLVFASLLSFSQENKIKLPIDNTTNLVTYQEVLQAPGVDKAELHNRARQWFALTFNSANDVLQMDDKGLGKLIGKGSSTEHYVVDNQPTMYTLSYTVSITIKEERYRYEISAFNITQQVLNSNHRITLEEYLKHDPTSNVGGYKFSEKIKTKALKTKEIIINQIFTSVDKLGKGISSDIKTSLSQSSKGTVSKDDF